MDFSYAVNGDTHGYSLPGGEKIALSTLTEALGIARGTEVGEFLAEVQNVAFSDPSLLKAAKDEAGNGWTLTSLKPFDTEEELTITMKHGDVIVVPVTDAPVSGYTDLETLADTITAHVTEATNNEIDGSSLNSSTTLHAELAYDITTKLSMYKDLVEAAQASGSNLKLDYDLTSLYDEHETLRTLGGAGKMIGEQGEIGAFRVENGHALIDLDASKLDANVDWARGTLSIYLQIDSTKAIESGNEIFEFPGSEDKLTIHWPGQTHASGTKTVSEDTGSFYPGESGEYLEYDYTVTVAGGVGLGELKMYDHLPAGMELKDGSVKITRECTTRQQTSTRASTGVPWGDWTDVSEPITTITNPPVTVSGITVGDDGKFTVDVLHQLGLTTADTVTAGTSTATSRTRTITESTYTVTYTGRVKKSDALAAMGSGNSTQYKNTVQWNEETTPIGGGETTVTITKEEYTPGTKSLNGSSSNIQVSGADCVELNGKKYAVVSYTVTIKEPIDASTAVLTDTLGTGQLLPAGVNARLLVNGQVLDNQVTLTAENGVITYKLHEALAANGQSFTADTSYSLQYDTLVEVGAGEITNEADWTINGEPVDGGDETVTVTPKPYDQGDKQHNRTDTHVTGSGPWEIPWTIHTRQQQDAKNVVINDSFSTDQEVKADSFKIKIGAAEYNVPADAAYLHIDNTSHTFSIDFDEAIKALTGNNADPAFKAGTDYEVSYVSETSQYNLPATSETEKSVNHSWWTFDGTSDNPTNPEITLEKDEYKPGEKQVSTSEGTANGNWTTGGEAQVEAITINADDQKIDLNYKITLKEPMAGVTKAALTDTCSQYETVDFENMKIVVDGVDYAVPSDLITQNGKTFTVDFVAVMRHYKDNDYTLEKNKNYELLYSTSIPLTDDIKALLKSKNGNTNVIKGLTVGNSQAWSFDGPNGPQDKTGNPVEYTFKEKPYNGGAKGVAVYDAETGRQQTITTSENGKVITLVESDNNILKYTITLTEHRNASTVTLRDTYTGNQQLKTDSFTVSFMQNGQTVTINVPASSITTGPNSFEMSLTDILAAEDYTFTPNVTYTIRYEAAVTTSGSGEGGTGAGSEFSNTGTWDFGDGTGQGGGVGVNLGSKFIPGTKAVAVREEIGSTAINKSDWQILQEPEHYTNHRTQITNVGEPTDGKYHLDYTISIEEVKHVDTAVLTDTFQGRADQTLVPGSFSVLIEGEGEEIPIPDSFVDFTTPTVGFSLSFTDFLESIERTFEPNTRYDIHFTTETETVGNYSVDGDGADNKAKWTFNNEPDLEGGHTETHLKTVPDVKKTYYNKDGVEKGDVGFGEIVKYVVTIGKAGDVLDEYWFEDHMTRYHHLDTEQPVKVSRGDNVLVDNLLNSHPTGWEFTKTTEPKYWDGTEYTAFTVKFPSKANNGGEDFVGPITVEYYARVGTQEQTKLLGEATVINHVKNDEVDVPTDFPLRSGTVTLDKVAESIDEDTLENKKIVAWWHVIVTPQDMSLKNLWLRDYDAKARINEKMKAMHVDTSNTEHTYHVYYVNDGEEHSAGDELPSNMYQVSSGNLKFLADITEPVKVRFATVYTGSDYKGGTVFLTNTAKITDESGKTTIGEPDTDTKEFVEGNITAQKEMSTVDKASGRVDWVITLTTEGSVTLKDCNVKENKLGSGATAEAAKSGATNVNKYHFKMDYSECVVKQGETELVKGVDYKADNHGITFLRDITAPEGNSVKIIVPTTITIPSGVTYVYNKATVKGHDGTETPVEGDGKIENYRLNVEKKITTNKVKAPNFNQAVTYRVIANEDKGTLPGGNNGNVKFTDVLPAGMEIDLDTLTLVFEEGEQKQKYHFLQV